jgi:predicted phosphodiesterase
MPRLCIIATMTAPIPPARTDSGSHWFLGDVHGDIAHVIAELVTARKRGKVPAAVIFLGDIEADRPFATIAAEVARAGGGTESWFIHGNHDSDQPAFARNLLDEAGAERNLHGRVVEIAGVRIAGLGGVFEKEIWHPEVNAGTPLWSSFADFAADQRRALDWGDADAARGRLLKHRTSIFFETYETLFDLAADILVLHEAPACHPHGFTVLDELAEAMGVARVFHGHHHDCLDYRVADPAVSGVGYRGISDLAGACVRKGTEDDARQHRPGC